MKYTEYNGSFSGGDVRISFGDTQKPWAASGWGNMYVMTGTPVTIEARPIEGYKFVK